MKKNLKTWKAPAPSSALPQRLDISSAQSAVRKIAVADVVVVRATAACVDVHGISLRGRLPAISDLLKEGQEILVQIAKEPIAKKGARITSHIALPGRYLVYMPTVHHTGVSRKIGSEEERHRLKRIALSERGDAQGGFIVRTAAAGAEEQDLRNDIRFLINLWNEIKGRAESIQSAGADLPRLESG